MSSPEFDEGRSKHQKPLRSELFERISVEIFCLIFYLQLKSLPKYAPVRRFDEVLYWRIVASLLKILTIILTKILTG